MSEKAISPQAQAALNEKYGLDKPLSEQYVTYMKDLLHGNLGLSVKQRGRTVNMIIASKVPGVRKSRRHRNLNGSSGGRSTGGVLPPLNEGRWWITS